MQLVQACDAIRITGLTAHQLREWCGRRQLVIPDQPAAGRGRHALFSWQTLLALRILKEIHDYFGVEVAAWAPAVASCQALLRGRSFPSLWGMSIVFYGLSDVQLVTHHSPLQHTASLRLPLDTHLQHLAAALSTPEMTQLPLFAAVPVAR